MKKNIFLLPFFLLMLSSFSLPTHLDYGEVLQKRKIADEIYWSTGLLAFNGAPELASLFTYLKHTYGIETAVETGTHRGNTTIFFSHLFNEVHTIEIVTSTYEKAKEKLSVSPNVHCHLGSSEVVLREILPTMCDRPVLFYLDAHWQARWPLRNELSEISKTHHDNCIIVIDDFQVPGREDIPFDKYGKHSCCYSYIRDLLEEVFSDYTFHFIIPKNPHCRAKFLAIPTSFSGTTKS